MIEVLSKKSMFVIALLPQDKMVQLVERLFSHRCDVPVSKVSKETLFSKKSKKSIHLQEDIAHVELKSVSSSQSVFTRSIFVRFHDIELRF